MESKKQKTQSPIKLQSIKELIPKYKAFLFDVDGVIWQGGKPIQSAVETFNHLISIGKVVCVYTNSTCSREAIQERLKKDGVELKIECVS